MYRLTLSLELFDTGSCNVPVGAVRGEPSTRLPAPVVATTPIAVAVQECEPNSTRPGVDPQPSTEEEEEVLHHYTSYTAALGVTVGVGVLLVLLNLLLFAGINQKKKTYANI